MLVRNKNILRFWIERKVENKNKPPLYLKIVFIRRSKQPFFAKSYGGFSQF